MKFDIIPKIKYLILISREKINEIRTPKKIKIVKGKYGISYLLVPNSALDFHIYKNGIYGDWLAQLDNSLFPSDGNVIEIGANVGLITLNLAKRTFPQGMIYAYEPDWENFNQLNLNLALNNLKNVHTYPIALQDDDKIEQINFYIRRAIDGDKKENRGLSSVIDIPTHQKESYKVFASTIDKEVERLQIKSVNLIKIDVEGAEHQVLLGGKATIEKLLPSIHYEFSVTLDGLLKKENARKSYDFLANLGYVQFAIMAEKNLKKIETIESIKQDINIIAFHESNLPKIYKNEN